MGTLFKAGAICIPRLLSFTGYYSSSLVIDTTIALVSLVCCVAYIASTLYRHETLIYAMQFLLI